MHGPMNVKFTAEYLLNCALHCLCLQVSCWRRQLISFYDYNGGEMINDFRASVDQITQVKQIAGINKCFPSTPKADFSQKVLR
jgi:hypothetical protein